MFKFSIGQTVKVDMSGKSPEWVWIGQVVKRNNVSEAYSYKGKLFTGNEYLVTNGPIVTGKSFPLLAWEEEMEAV